MNTFWAGIKTIAVADVLTNVDNVPDVAGAAGDSFDMIIVGLLISFPTAVFGSTMVLKLVGRFSAIINIGAAVLASTGTKMILSGPLLNGSYRNADAAASGANLQQRRAMGHL